MGKTFEAITPKIRDWVAAQQMFFVATAPLSGQGLVNLSPKGMDSFRILGDRRVAYLDLTGSGIETVAHLKENGRITIMFCAFEGPPKIYRFQGIGTVHEKGSAKYQELIGNFTEHLGARAIIDIEVTRISDSCGFSVPLYDFKAQRDTLMKVSEKEGEDGLLRYQQKNNLKSLDGLPGLAKSP